MKTRAAIPMSLVVAVMWDPNARGADLIDYPGPEYREQSQKVLPAPRVSIRIPSVDFLRTAPFRIEATRGVEHRTLGEPIRLFDQGDEVSRGDPKPAKKKYPLLDAPGAGYREQRARFAPRR